MIELQGLPVRVEPMSVYDIGEILTIERASFSAPWSARAYEYELRYNDMAHYYVARAQQPNGADAGSQPGPLARLAAWLRPPPPLDALAVLGYVGFWLMAGEAHISTIAVSPMQRGHSIGELLLAAAVSEAMRMGASVATLEVRVSNTVAQRLYDKYGFEKVGIRKAYYSDNNEDAFIMTTPTLASADYQQKFTRLTNALRRRLDRRPQSPPARQHVHGEQST